AHGRQLQCGVEAVAARALGLLLPLREHGGVVALGALLQFGERGARGLAAAEATVDELRQRQVGERRGFLPTTEEQHARTQRSDGDVGVHAGIVPRRPASRAAAGSAKVATGSGKIVAAAGKLLRPSRPRRGGRARRARRTTRISTATRRAATR